MNQKTIVPGSDQQPAAPVQTSAQPAAEQKGPVFCKDCTHIRHADQPAPFCAAVTAEVSLVHGSQNAFCEDARHERGECGVEGRLFAPRHHADTINVVYSTGSIDALPATGSCDHRFAVVTLSPQPAEPASAVRTVTFASDHLIAIELALEERIFFIERMIAYNPGDMHWTDSLDVARQALELVQ